MFSGLVYCADCGAKLYYHIIGKYKDGSQDNFMCSSYKIDTKSCTIHHIRECILHSQVLSCIRETLHTVRLVKEEFRQELLQQDEHKRGMELGQKSKMLLKAEGRLTELDSLIKRVYEDNTFGRLSESRFQKLSDDFEAEQRALTVSRDRLDSVDMSSY